jgi:hypothetical protein
MSLHRSALLVGISAYRPALAWIRLNSKALGWLCGALVAVVSPGEVFPAEVNEAMDCPPDDDGLQVGEWIRGTSAGWPSPNPDAVRRGALAASSFGGRGRYPTDGRTRLVVVNARAPSIIAPATAAGLSRPSYSFL